MDALTPTKPLLLLDLDGVLSCFGDTDRVDVVHDRLTQPRGSVILVPSGSAQRISTLATHFDMVWATTWEHEAVEQFAVPIGIPGADRWPVIEFRNTQAGGTWKLNDVKLFAARHAGRPLAWIDDEIHPDARDWAQQRNEQGQPTLLIRPMPERGLDDEQTAQLIIWAKTGC
jgi:hypothetical protein